MLVDRSIAVSLYLAFLTVVQQNGYALPKNAARGELDGQFVNCN